MDATGIAKKYLECFFGKLPLEGMEELLADELQFTGPFHQYNSAQDYFQALINDPPVDVSYKILYEFEKLDTVCIVYEFSKAAVKTNMAQIFEIRDGKIYKIILIFDTTAFGSAS